MNADPTRGSGRAGRRIRAAALSAALVSVLVPAVLAQPVRALGTCSASWTVSPVAPAPVPVLQIMLNGLSLTPSSAWTVGGLTDTANTFHAYAQYFNGSNWSLGTPADAGPHTVDTWLNDVKAFPSGPSGQPEAWAVGYGGPASTFLRPQMIVEHWIGPDPASPWHLSAPTTPTGTYTNLVSVTGTSATDLWAVGSTRTGATYRALIEHYDGKGWSSVPAAPLPASTTSSGLISVSAAGPSDVWAVGFRTNGDGYGTLAEHFDGSSWTAVATPSPGTTEDVLLGVAAVGGQAWAVGYRSDGTGARALVEHYDGTAWSSVAAPGPFSLIDVLRSVTVEPTTGRLWATGFTFAPGTSPFQALVVTADPSAPALTWTRTPTATENGAVLGREFKKIAAEQTGNHLWVVGSTGEPLIETICPASGAAIVAEPKAGSTSASSPGQGARAPSEPQGAVGALRPGSGLTIAQDVAASVLPGEPALVRTNGAAVGDFAGPNGPGKDGYPDFEIGRFGDAPMELWVNQRDGTWAQVDAGNFPVADRYYCAFGDVGSETSTAPDGLPDLFCSIGAAKGTGIKINELWTQRPDGSFARPITQPGVFDPFGRGRVAAMFYPGDQRTSGPHPVSLFLGNQLGRGDGVPDPNRFYLNQDGALVDTPAAGLDVETGASCVQPVDVNRDHFTDLLLCTNVGRLALFRNDGTGPGGVPSFTEVSQLAHIGQGGVTFGLMEDLNGDRCPDLAEVFGKRLDILGQDVTSGGRCTGSFARVWSRPLTQGRWLAAGDVNGDHRSDLYVLQGQTAPDVMLLNEGHGWNFSSIPIPEATAGWGDVVQPMKDRATGLTDFLVLNGDHTHGPVQLIRFFPNPSPNPVKITSAPPNSTTSTKASFEFRSSVGSRFVCSLDGADPEVCRSGVKYRGLDRGRHHFAVWAANRAGDPLAEATDAFKVVA
jgi:hypothetical protein